MSKELKAVEKNDGIEMQIECLRGIYLTNLKRKIEYLVTDLQRELEEINRCEETGRQYRPNSCGIIQGSAQNIDELCIKLGVLDSVQLK